MVGGAFVLQLSRRERAKHDSKSRHGLTVLSLISGSGCLFDIADKCSGFRNADSKMTICPSKFMTLANTAYQGV
jgi:hypothetical protein